jgi:hypothetical protein
MLKRKEKKTYERTETLLIQKLNNFFLKRWHREKKLTCNTQWPLQWTLQWVPTQLYIVTICNNKLKDVTKNLTWNKKKRFMKERNLLLLVDNDRNDHHNENKML